MELLNHLNEKKKTTANANMIISLSSALSFDLASDFRSSFFVAFPPHFHSINNINQQHRRNIVSMIVYVFVGIIGD